VKRFAAKSPRSSTIAAIKDLLLVFKKVAMHREEKHKTLKLSIFFSPPFRLLI
jgi:hypothetical protein